MSVNIRQIIVDFPTKLRLKRSSGNTKKSQAMIYSIFGPRSVVRGFSTFTNGVGWGISIPQLGNSGAVAVTKYRITRPYRDDTTWDDFLIALPEKDQLAKFSKDVPLFIRYLKLVTDVDGRNEQFKEFFRRCKDGLTVESDVFITTDELLSVMWKNGYSEQERNAIQFTFPSDYKFHYPELSVLFDVAEEDAYKFCMRARMDKSHIGELDAEKTKRGGLLRDHWLLYAGGWYIFKNYPFFSYVFFLKTWGFTTWFISCWYLFGRMATKIWRRNEQMQLQKTADEVMAGEDGIVANMRKFANDSNAVEYLKQFKPEAQSSLAEFRSAMVESQKSAVTERINAQLEAIARMEQASAGNMQELLVSETTNSFKEAFAASPKMQEAAFEAALASIKGGAEKSADPVLKHFTDSIKAVETADWSKVRPSKSGSIVERIAMVRKNAEQEFRKMFYVSKAEASEVREFAKKAQTGGKLDFSKLDAAEAKRLDDLFTSINNRVGFVVPSETSILSLGVEGSYHGAQEFVESTKGQIDQVAAKIRHERLAAFVKGF